MSCEDAITKRFPDSGMATLSFDLWNVFHNGSFFFVNSSAAPSLEITEGVRHYNREKTIGPAKPLWFVSGNGFTMEADTYYKVA